MRPNRTLSLAIAAILGGQSVAPRVLHAADADGSADTLQEITVTAQRRSQNMQDVPIQIQALTSATLTQLNVTTLDDFVKFLPNVTVAGSGPGQGNIFMRGLSVGGGLTQTSGSVGSFPNVAVYLDEQSVQLPGRNLDIYAADLERIEVLEGPQGTLFGAGAQAGVLRYITNKPKLNVFEGSANAGYADTTHGDRSSNVDATVNLPVIQDRLAVRATIYNEKRGGYIDNVPGTFVRQSTDGGIAYAGYINNIPGPATPQNSASNFNLVARAINPVTYSGIRAAALLQINDDWSALLTQSYQDMEADGVFYQTPNASGVPAVPLPDLSVQIYNPSYDKDRFENTALTITGRIAALKVVYAGGYLVRNIEQVQDYTAYARGIYADYYQCISPAQSSQAAQCYSPSSTWRDHERNTHNSQELRISTPDDWRVRAIGGIFWESYKIFEDIDWSYKTAPGFTDIAPPAGSQANDPNLRASNVAFLDDISRGYTQRAAFGSVDFDIIPKTLTLTAGTRYYRMNTTARGYSVGSFGCYADGPPPCTGNIPFANDLTAQHLDKTYSGFRSRVNLSWKVTDDALLYYTWSQGFRPGGFNRGSSLHLNDTFLTPVSYAPDTLINNEIGWKTQWVDNRLQFNGAVYQEDWKDVQVTFFDPGELGNLNFTTNGPNYRVRGVETEISARVLHGLTLSASGAWNSSSLVNSPYLIGVDGQPIVSIPNPYGATGTPLADSPPFQGTLRARYETQLGDYLAFCQAAATHQAHSYSATGNIVQFEQPPFSTYDASIGVSRGSWSLQLYGTNLTDTRAVLTANDNQFVPQQTVNRPRTIGIKYSYHQ